MFICLYIHITPSPVVSDKVQFLLRIKGRKPCSKPPSLLVSFFPEHSLMV